LKLSGSSRVVIRMMSSMLTSPVAKSENLLTALERSLVQPRHSGVILPSTATECHEPLSLAQQFLDLRRTEADHQRRIWWFLGLTMASGLAVAVSQLAA
jgi:hypothetical protein